MLEVIVHPLPKLTTEIMESPIPIPGPDKILVKVEVAASNVKDWLHLTTRKMSMNSGDDMAGTVYTMGENVESAGDFHFGDRVAAFHPMFTPGGHMLNTRLLHDLPGINHPPRTNNSGPLPLPYTRPFAALFSLLYLTTTLPTNAFNHLRRLLLTRFICPKTRPSIKHPPHLAIAGSSTTHLLSLLDATKGDVLIEYRKGISAMQNAVRTVLAERNLEARHAIDAISSNRSWTPIAQLLAPGGFLSVVSGANHYDEPEIPEGVDVKYTFVGAVHEGGYEKGMPRQPSEEVMNGMPNFAGEMFGWLEGEDGSLARGMMRGHPFMVVPGRLAGVGEGLRMLRDGKTGGKKFVYMVSEKEG